MLEICVQSSGWFKKEDPDGSFAFIKSCGFEAVDFNIDTYLPVDSLSKSDEPPTSFFDQSVDDLLEFFTPLKEAAEKNGITFAQMHGPFPVWHDDRPDLMDHVLMATEKCLAVCQYVGCPAIVVHPDRKFDKAAEFEHNMALYRRLIPAAVKTGVKVCTENLPMRFNGRFIDGVCNDGAEVCRYIDTLNAEAACDAFGYCFDLGHANLIGCNIREHLKTVGNRLTVLHMHDNNGITDWHTAPYTCVSPTGLQTDWEALITGLKDIGYRGPLNFETFRVLTYLPEQLKGDILRYIAAVGRYFRERIMD